MHSRNLQKYHSAAARTRCGVHRSAVPLVYSINELTFSTQHSRTLAVRTTVAYCTVYRTRTTHAHTSVLCLVSRARRPRARATAQPPRLSEGTAGGRGIDLVQGFGLLLAYCTVGWVFYGALSFLKYSFCRLQQDRAAQSTSTRFTARRQHPPGGPLRARGGQTSGDLNASCARAGGIARDCV